MKIEAAGEVYCGRSQPAETEMVQATETVHCRKKRSRRRSWEDRLNIVVFGDSIWDMVQEGIRVLRLRLLIIWMQMCIIVQ